MKPRFSLLGLVGAVTIIALLFIASLNSHRARKAESDLLRLSKTTPVPQEPTTKPNEKSLAFGVLAKTTKLNSNHVELRNHKSGLKVEWVDAGTDAHHSGIFAGDTIVSMAGWKIESPDNLDYVYNHIVDNPNELHTFLALRDGKLISGEVHGD